MRLCAQYSAFDRELQRGALLMRIRRASTHGEGLFQMKGHAELHCDPARREQRAISEALMLHSKHVS